MRKEIPRDTIVIGGLHKNDFEWASKQGEALDYVFVGFELDVDGYHWKAIYTKAGYPQNASPPGYTGNIER